MYTVEEAMNDWACDRATAIFCLRKLARRGFGAFKNGRKGWPTRLER